ncbi:MAG: hypothetical protein ACOC0L_01770 [bacterium]
MTEHLPNRDASNVTARLHAEVDELFTLNPDRADMRREHMIALAEQCPADCFEQFSERAKALVDSYLKAPWKAAGRSILDQYFEAVSRSAQRLIDQGELTDTALKSGTDEKDGERSRQALQPLRNADAKEWPRIMDEARIPQTLSAAADAYRNRASRVSGVLELMFRILLRIDRDAAFDWQMSLADRQRDNPDPELIRDLLRAWHTALPLPRDVCERVLTWSTLPELLRDWPAVVRQADALLQRTALELLAASPTPSNSHLRLLHTLAGDSRPSRAELRRWLDVALQSLGETIEFFVRMADLTPERECEGALCRSDWSRAAVVRELESIEALYPRLLLLADLVLRTPDGAANFAYSLFGFTEEGWRRWREGLETYAREVINHQFLRNLREQRSVAPIIERLTFGNENLLLKLKGHLDLMSGQFLSIADRDAAARELAPYYASFREQEFLAREITRRYRRLMRVLHADNLNRIIGDQAERFVESRALRELSSLAAEARAYLGHRRNLHAPLEDTLAAEADFIYTIRRQRADVIRRMK